MSDQIQLTLPDGSVREVDHGTTPLAVAESIGPGLAKAAVGAEVDGRLVDLRAPLVASGACRLITARNEEAGVFLRHTAEHVLADAVQRLWPGTQIDVGRRDHSEKYQYDFRFPARFRTPGPGSDRSEDARDPGREARGGAGSRSLADGRTSCSPTWEKSSSSSGWKTYPKASRSPCSGTGSSSISAAVPTHSGWTRSARSSCWKVPACSTEATRAGSSCSASTAPPSRPAAH